MLLVAGWLAVLDAFVSLLITTSPKGLSHWLGSALPGMDWEKLLWLDRITDLLGLLFWGYFIYVMQVDTQVKREFFAPPPRLTATIRR